MRVPVSYPFRCSGPVTVLTARRIWYGVGTDLICHPSARPSAREKDAFVPRRFFNSSLHPLFPSFSCTVAVPWVSLSSTFSYPPPGPTERYNAASKNNASSRLPALIYWLLQQQCLNYLLDRHVR